jgi:acyl-CoA thioester hydrolase
MRIHGGRFLIFLRWMLIHLHKQTVVSNSQQAVFCMANSEFCHKNSILCCQLAITTLLESYSSPPTGHDRSALMETAVLMNSASELLVTVPDAPALFFAPFVSSRMAIEKDWIDYNGHLNMAYYNVLFDRAVDEAFGLCGLGPDYIHDRNHSFFLVESRIRYRRELTLDNPVRVTLQLVDFDDKRLHYTMDLRHAVDGWLAAACENLSINVDMATRRAAPFPTDILANLAIMKAAHASLPQPDMLGTGVAMPTRRPEIN